MSESLPTTDAISDDAIKANFDVGDTAKAYRVRDLPPTGQVVGLSLSGCVEAIKNGFPIERVARIITGAQIDFSVPGSAEVWAEKNLLESDAIPILERLFREGKIVVVDRDTASPDRSDGDWLLETEMSSPDDYPRFIRSRN